MTPLLPPPRAGWYVVWVLLGVIGSLALLATFTPFVLLVPIVACLGVLVASRPRARAAAPAAICGVALPVLFVAWLNRDGPGNVCTVTSAGTSCVEEWSPWPFLVVAAALVTSGVAGCVAARHAARTRHEATPAHRTGAEVSPRG